MLFLTTSGPQCSSCLVRFVSVFGDSPGVLCPVHIHGSCAVAAAVAVVLLAVAVPASCHQVVRVRVSVRPLRPGVGRE